MSDNSLESAMVRLVSAIDACCASIDTFTKTLATAGAAPEAEQPEKKKAPKRKAPKKQDEKPAPVEAPIDLNTVRKRLHDLQKVAGVEEVKKRLVEEFGKRRFTDMEPEQLDQVHEFLAALEKEALQWGDTDG